MIRHQGQTNHEDKLSGLYIGCACGCVAAQVCRYYTTTGSPGSPIEMLQSHGNNPFCYTGTSPQTAMWLFLSISSHIIMVKILGHAKMEQFSCY